MCCHFELKHNAEGDCPDETKEQLHSDALRGSLVWLLPKMLWAIRVGIEIFWVVAWPEEWLRRMCFHALKVSCLCLPLPVGCRDIAWILLTSIAMENHFSYHIITLMCKMTILSRTCFDNLPCRKCDPWQHLQIDAVAECSRHQGQKCAHCWRDWNVGERVLVLQCQHVYHEVCIEEWFRISKTRACPTCRTDLPGARSRRTDDNELLEMLFAWGDPWRLLGL